MALSTSASGTIHYDRTGNGPTLILLHGVGSSGQMWHDRGYVRAFAPHFDTITVDLPGFGRSTGPLAPETFGLRGNTDAVATLMDEFAIEQAALCGYSWGGMTSLRFAAAYPDRLWALAVGAANAAGRRANYEAWGRHRPPLHVRLLPGIRRRAAAAIRRMTKTDRGDD